MNEQAHWTPYQPTKEQPWNLARVVHLHRRAGFGATWQEIQRDLKDGPQTSIDRVLQGKSRLNGVPEHFEETANLLGETASRNIGRLKAWWIYRMLFGPDPLSEKMTLLWHNHFATSVDKIQNTLIMKQQNELFRKHGRSTFVELLNAVVRDPALLIWLDAPTNRKGHANENLARELMELFTLGIGNYTERDVKEGARALTGWTVKGNRSQRYREFENNAENHDTSEKLILKQRGQWTGKDFLRILLEHPATSRRITWRLCTLFFGESTLDDKAQEQLTEGLRKNDLSIKWALETILRSRAFFTETNLRCRVLSPTELVVSSTRMLEMFNNPPSTLLLADWAARLGQDLFTPPNVGGWAGGRRWISTRTMISRANFAAALIGGKLPRNKQPFDALALAKEHTKVSDLSSLIEFYSQLCFGIISDDTLKNRILKALGANAPLNAKNARYALALLLASPDAQIA